MHKPKPLQFAFVQTDGPSGKPKASDGRSLVRSHCMRGKNKREDSRRSVRQARKHLHVKGGTAVQRSRVEDEGPIHADDPDASHVVLPSPHAPPPDMALVMLAVDVDGQSQELLFKFLTCDAIKHMYPVIGCVDFHKTDADYFRWLYHDDIYVHSTLLTATVVDDFFNERPPARATFLHLWRTIALLNERLSEKEGYLVDSTVYVVMALISITDLFGDRDAFNAHMIGLCRILQMRGGIASLRRTPKLYFKVGRLDLEWALSTGNKPCLLPREVSWEPFYNNPMAAVVEISRGPGDDGDIDFRTFATTFLGPRLATIFHDLREMTRLIDQHTRNNTRLEGLEFQDAIYSAQSRLLHLEDSIDGGRNDEKIVAECLRLGMLAFLSTTFRVPGRRARPLYLTEQLRSASQRIEPSTPELRVAVLWLLIVSAISVLDIDEPWLRAKWNVVVGSRLPSLSFKEALKKLRSVMWISSIHDDLGKKAFMKLMGQDKI